MLQKGKLPISEFIILESNANQWTLLKNKLVKEIKFKGYIKITPEKKVAVNLVILQAIHSSQSPSKTTFSLDTYMSAETALGLKRISEFLNDFLNNHCWLLFGYIDGENRIPVIINYYEEFNFAIYSQKTGKELDNQFFPLGVNPINN